MVNGFESGSEIVWGSKVSPFTGNQELMSTLLIDKWWNSSNSCKSIKLY